MVGIEELVAQAGTALGWSGEIAVSPGPRGALGQIWRVDVGSFRYALKHIFDEPPTEDSIGVELDLARRARHAGVHLPASHPDHHGRYLWTAPDGTWLRCYDWLDLQSVRADAAGTAGQIGVLLARLHRCAPAASSEPNGSGPMDPWYHQPPSSQAWAHVATSAAPWATRLGARLGTLPQLCAAIRPAEPARLLLCHRDLHPENVFSDPAGELVVVDWDDLGPAEPGQELARVLFDWCCTETTTDLGAVQALVTSYVEAGGPGRITEPADFTMLLACRLNFLLAQTHLALDLGVERPHREWAEHEIEVMLHLMPTPRQLADVLITARRQCPVRSAP